MREMVCEFVTVSECVSVFMKHKGWGISRKRVCVSVCVGVRKCGCV